MYYCYPAGLTPLLFSFAKAKQCVIISFAPAKLTCVLLPCGATAPPT